MNSSERTERNEEKCYDLPVEGKTPGQIALDRCSCLIKQYLRWKKKNHLRSNLAQVAALVFTAVIPVVLLLPYSQENVKICGAALSALAAIATGLLAICGWRENFIRYGYIFHMLQVEKQLYLARATKEYSDKDPEETARNFAIRTEKLVTLDVNEWRTEMERIDDRRQYNDRGSNSSSADT